jgi:hypothetical protein
MGASATLGQNAMVDDTARTNEKTHNANSITDPIEGGPFRSARRVESDKAADCCYEKSDCHDAKASVFRLATEQLEPQALHLALSHGRCLTLELSGRC